MICRNCKFNLQGSEKYCPNCGAPLCEEKDTPEAPSAAPRTPEIFFTPVKQEETGPEIFRSESAAEKKESDAPPPKKSCSKSSSKAPVMLMLVLIIAVLTIGVFVAAEKFNIAPTLLSYLNGGVRSETDAQEDELVYFPEKKPQPSPGSGTVAPDISYAPTEAFVAKINILSLRKGPSDAYGLIRSLDAGTPLQIMGGTAVTDSWIYIYVPGEECYGWVNAAFVSLYTYTEPTSEAQMREYLAFSEKE